MIREATEHGIDTVEAPLLNTPRGVPSVDSRRVLNGIFWVFAVWCTVARPTGTLRPTHTCYNRFVRWRKAGVWDRMMDAITAAHDGQAADALLKHLGPRTIVLVDEAYDADRIRALIERQVATPSIPPKSNRRWKPCFSKRLYREHNPIERFFSKLKHYRRVATRYDKLNFLAMAQLASIRLWLRVYKLRPSLKD